MTLQQILFWSLRGSGLILLGMLLGRQKQKIPAKGMLLLWQAAILRLCLPGQIALPVPWMTADVSQRAQEGGQMQIWLWACGVFVAGMALAFRWQRGRRLLAKARPLSDASCRQWLGGGTKRKVKVMLCPGIRTPLAAGLLRPYILLPQDMDRQDKERLRFVITHEMVHIRRWDLWWKGLALLCRCLHWFNPLVWLLPALLEGDMERSCDEACLEHLGSGQKKRYALALWSLAQEQSAFWEGACGFGTSGLEERIGLIMNYKKISRVTIGLCALGVCAAAGVSAVALVPEKHGSYAMKVQGDQVVFEPVSGEETGSNIYFMEKTEEGFLLRMADN